MTEVRNYIESIVKISDAEWSAFSQKLVKQKLAKHDFLLQEYQICDYAAFVADGAFSFYKVKEGIEMVTALFFSGDFVSDYQSFLTGQPSEYYIQSLKESEIYVFHKKDLHELYNQYQNIERFGRISAEKLFLTTNKRLNSFLYKTPEERYDELIKRNSKLLQEVPQYMIASYLGIKPESLSRIRKRKID